MIEKISFKNSLGYTLAGVLHTPPHQQLVGGGGKPNKNVEHPVGIIICHGLPGTKDEPLQVALTKGLEKYFVVLRLDFTGHGESEGEFTEGTYTQWIDDIKKAIDFLNSRNIRRIGLVGHSQGGGCIVLAASQDKRINALVPIAPVGYPAKLKSRLSMEGRGADTLDELLARGEPYVYKSPSLGDFPLHKNFFDDLAQQDIIAAAQLVQQPTHIIHGDQDTSVDPQESLDIFNNLRTGDPIKKRTIIKGADHKFNDYDSELVGQVVSLATDWFKGCHHLDYISEAIRAWVMHDGKMLLLKRSERMESYPGKWSCVGGYHEAGKSFAEHALAEIEEELGVPVAQVKIIKESKQPLELHDTDSDKIWRIHQLLVEISTDKIKLDWEHTEYKWIEPSDLKGYDLIPAMLEGYKSFMNE